jgi:hypothetical protein
VFAFTVDFKYLDAEFSFPGAGKYAVRSILDEIQARMTENGNTVDFSGEIKDVKRELVEGEDDPDKLSLLNEDGQWYLTNKIAFEDTYKLTVTVGINVLEIRVTDAKNLVINFFDVDGTTPVAADMSGFKYLAVIGGCRCIYFTGIYT